MPKEEIDWSLAQEQIDEQNKLMARIVTCLEHAQKSIDDANTLRLKFQDAMTVSTKLLGAMADAYGPLGGERPQVVKDFLAKYDKGKPPHG